MWSHPFQGISGGAVFDQVVEATERTGHNIGILDAEHFLDEYGLVFSDYSKAVDHYVKHVAAALETPESKMPLSTLVVARLCKIRILITYLGMTKVIFFGVYR
jgi:hypothetical protein